MKSLKELMERYKYSDMSDIEIIKEYFVQNELEQKGIDLMNDLSKAKIQKLQNKNYLAEEWVCMLPSKYLYQNYNLDVADKLHLLELNYLTHGGELTESKLEWAKENIPKIKEPECYFVPLIDWLKNRGIEFKGR